MKTGKIYRRFKATSGETVTLRALRWEDLDSCVVFVNDLVGEKKTEPNLGVMVDTRQTGEGEAEWLTNQLTGIEKGNIVSVVADVRGKIVGNSDVTRGPYKDTKRHGYLGIAISKKSRDKGIGLGDDAHPSQGKPKGGTQNNSAGTLRQQPTRDPRVREDRFQTIRSNTKKMLRNSKFIDSIIMTRDL